MLFSLWRRKGKVSLERWFALRHMRQQRSLAPRRRLFLEVLEDRLAPAVGFASLYSFTGSDGWNPRGGVTLDGSGNLYGTAKFATTSQGTAYQFNLSSNTLTTLHAFTNATGVAPQGTLLRDSSGDLYGTTTSGGNGNWGTVFELSANGSYTVLHSFTGSDGWSPQGNLIMDSQGNLYGTTNIGTGAASNGTVYELSPNGTGSYNFTTLHFFAGGSSDGSEPNDGLYMDSKGNLYGTTEYGGASGSGTVFELSPNGTGGYNSSIIYSFKGSGNGGVFPIGGVIMDNSGNLYGTAQQGGTSVDGTVYRLSPNGTGGYSLTTLYSFTGGDGSLPQDALLMDSQGNLFGTTSGGGSNNLGTVFELSPNSSGSYNFNSLHSFNGNDGSNPVASLTADPSGNLYGTTSSGGNLDYGTIFEITGAAAPAPTITSSTASLPATATSLTINGTNFSSTPADDSVTFDNGVTGTVTSATATSLTVRLSGLGSVIAGTALHASVMVNGATSGSPVQVATVAPAITSSTANLPANATSLVINGGGFDSNAANDSVTFSNGVTGTVTSASATSLTVSNLSGLSSLAGGTALDASVTIDNISSGSQVQVATIAPVITSSTAGLPLDATSMTISGLGFDSNAANDSVTFDHGVTGTVTSASATSLTVSNLNGLGSLSAGTSLHARVKVNGISSGFLVQVATLTPASTTIAAVSTTASFSESAQNATLTANVTSSARTVNEGTVTFTLLDSNGKTVGSPMPPSAVRNGQASVTYALPAGQAPGTYTIDAVYNPGSDFQTSSDDTHTLLINPAATTTTASNATVTFSTGTQDVTLSANVASSAGAVNDGTVTFTLFDSNGHQVGSPAYSNSVSNGQASATYVLQPSTPIGTYTVDASYSDSGTGNSGDFAASSDSTHSLTVNPVSTTTTAGTTTPVTFSESSQTVTLTANVASGAGPVNEGMVTFTLFDSNGHQVGSPAYSNSVSNGQASATYVLQPSTLAGTYTVDASYSDTGTGSSGDFAASSDTSQTLVIQPASTTLAAGNATTFFNPGTQNVTLTANVSSAAGAVNEGSVAFTVSQGSMVLSTLSSSVSNGTASINNYPLPARLAPGSYTITAVYTPGSDFTGSSDNSHTLTIAPDNVTDAIVAANNQIVATYSPNTVTLLLNASVADASSPSIPVNEGAVTFTLMNGSTSIVSSNPINVSGGQASTTFALPPGLPVGTYTIAISYKDNQGNFTDAGDTNVTLSDTPAGVTTTAGNISVLFSPNAQTITVNATVHDDVVPGGLVGEGIVTFTVLNGQTILGTSQGNVLGGQASAQLPLLAGQAAGTYTIAVSYSDKKPGNFTDNGDTNAALTIQMAPTVTANPPANLTVTTGGTAIFKAAADGNPAPTVQWQASSDGGAHWNNLNDGNGVSGSSSTTLTLNNVSFASNGQEYRAVFSSSLGTTTSTAATLTVQIPPAITSGNSAAFTVGQSGSFTVTATGSPTPSLTVSGGLPSGVTFTDNGNGTATLAGTPAAGTNGTYQVSVMANNGAGSDFVQSFTLTVNAAPTSPSPAVTSAPPALVLKAPYLLSLIDMMLGAIETINANGTETVTDSLFGMPLLVSTYDSSGNLLSVTMLGFNITSMFV